MPHDYDDDAVTGFGLGEHIDEASSVDASGTGYQIPSTPWIITPYRSVAVFVKPSSSMAATVRVTWDYDGLAGGKDVEETKVGTLLKGETFIFRNHGVQITDIRITADADTAYVVSPSNVDPLADAPATGLSILSLIRSSTIQTLVSGVATAIAYGVDPSTRFYTNDAACWSYTLDANLDIVKVHVEKEGLYLARSHFLFGGAAGNYNKSMALAVFSSVPYPPLTGSQADATFDTNEVNNEASLIFGIRAADVGSANNNISVGATQVSGTNRTVGDARLQIVRLSPAFP